MKCHVCGCICDSEDEFCKGCNAELRYDWIEEQNQKITHWILIVFVSMMTSLITVFLATGSIGL